MRKPPNREQYLSTRNTGSKRRETACGRECSKWTSPVAGADRIIVEPESFGCLVSAALALPLPIEKDNLGGHGDSCVGWSRSTSDRPQSGSAHRRSGMCRARLARQALVVANVCF